jgi:hypothetical protein
LPFYGPQATDILQAHPGEIQSLTSDPHIVPDAEQTYLNLPRDLTSLNNSDSLEMSNPIPDFTQFSGSLFGFDQQDGRNFTSTAYPQHFPLAQTIEQFPNSQLGGM